MTARDYDVVEFIRDYKIASTDTIQRFFFPSKRVAQARLKILNEKKLLNRSRDTINSQYVYYLRKPKQLRHSLLVTDFYRELSRVCKVALFRIEPQIANIRPDAIFGYSYNNKDYIGLLEIEISHKGFNYSKYSAINFENILPVKPRIFIVGDHIKPSPGKLSFDFKILKTDLKGVREAIR